MDPKLNVKPPDAGAAVEVAGAADEAVVAGAAAGAPKLKVDVGVEAAGGGAAAPNVNFAGGVAGAADAVTPSEPVDGAPNVNFGGPVASAIAGGAFAPLLVGADDEEAVAPKVKDALGAAAGGACGATCG